MQAHLWHQDDGYSQQRNDEGADASIDNGGESSSGSGTRVWGTYQTVGPGKRIVMEYCGKGKYNKWLVAIGEAFVELENTWMQVIMTRICPICSTWVLASLKLLDGLTGSDL
jgi:hypothetical protein